jgi:hypothetical protein
MLKASINIGSFQSIGLQFNLNLHKIKTCMATRISQSNTVLREVIANDAVAERREQIMGQGRAKLEKFIKIIQTIKHHTLKTFKLCITVNTVVKSLLYKVIE